MNNLVKTRNLIIVILCLTIVCMGIGFSFISMKLEKQSAEEPKYSVEITKVLKKTAIQGGLKEPTVSSSITNANQTINLEFNLSSPRDEITYIVIIKNTGNIKAEIINLIESPDYIGDYQEAQKIYPIKISHSDINGKILAPGEMIELKITASYDAIAQSVEVKVPYQISVISKSK